jgi:hypothetical protein
VPDVGDRKHIRAARSGPVDRRLWGYGSRDELAEAGAEVLIDAPADFRADWPSQAASS